MGLGGGGGGLKNIVTLKQSSFPSHLYQQVIKYFLSENKRYLEKLNCGN